MTHKKLRSATALSFLAMLLVMLVACNATATAQEDPADLSVEQRASYALGVNLAQQLSHDNIELDLEYFARGAKDVMGGKEPMLDETALRAAVQELQAKAGAARQAKMKVEAEANSAKGNAFLAENKDQEGVVETASGLQYKILTAADGPKPTKTDRVKIHYTGTTLDGTVFDSSVERGTPATFGVSQVIPGFTEALLLMSPGAKYKVWIPDNLGYGLNVRPGSKFGPNDLLVFEIEMLEIVK